MLFSSLIFLFVFLPSVILIYFICPKRLKNMVLLVFSLFFYAYGEPKYLIIMIFSILINYVFGILVDKYRMDKRKSNLILFLAVISNMSIIGYYKYTNFIIDNINLILKSNIPFMKIMMPIGISFFTFQGLSYVIDIYRENGKVQKNPLNVALYISLFPQLIAGPIVRYETVAEQIDYRDETVDKFSEGIERFIIGLGKKVIIANSMGLIADEVFRTNINELTVLLSWVGIISYTFQIYFDFSGYSDMAIGLGKMFGFEFLENFNYPYISKSITEYWRRWHISLGTWFRDYVYIPLGGNKVSKLLHLRNIFIVWFLTGLWHGASWNFVAWGLYFGVLLCLEKFYFGKHIKKLWTPLQHAYTMLLVIIGWVLFRSETLAYALDYISIMMGARGTDLFNPQALYYIFEYKIEFILAIIASIPIYPLFIDRYKKISNYKLKIAVGYYMKPVILIGLFLLCIMYLVNSTFNPFIYFRF